MKKNINVNCPRCKKKFSYYTSESRPFCSDKCKMIDMGTWLTENYQIAGQTNSVYIEDAEKLETLLERYNEDL